MKKRLKARIGIETVGGVFAVILARRTPLPCEKAEVFTTADDDQSEIKIRVFQGNAASTSRRRMRELGEFRIVGIPPARRGTPKVEVVFSVTLDGVFGLRATDVTSGIELAIS